MKKILSLAAIIAFVASFSGILLAEEQIQANKPAASAPSISDFSGKTYVCETDEYSQDKPGTCPTCGNELVEKEVGSPAITETPEVPEEETPEVPTEKDTEASVGNESPAAATK